MGPSGASGTDGRIVDRPHRAKRLGRLVTDLCRSWPIAIGPVRPSFREATFLRDHRGDVSRFSVKDHAGAIERRGQSKRHAIWRGPQGEIPKRQITSRFLSRADDTRWNLSRQDRPDLRMGTLEGVRRSSKQAEHRSNHTEPIPPNGRHGRSPVCTENACSGHDSPRIKATCAQLRSLARTPRPSALSTRGRAAGNAAPRSNSSPRHGSYRYRDPRLE